jgi:hypothetical protein
MEKLTAKELIASLDFSKDIDGVSTSITKGHGLFNDNLASWLNDRVSAEWDNDLCAMVLHPEDGEPFSMNMNEYRKL